MWTKDKSVNDFLNLDSLWWRHTYDDKFTSFVSNVWTSLFIFLGSKNKFSHFIASRFMKGFGSYFNFQQRDLYKVLFFNIRLTSVTCLTWLALPWEERKKLKKLKTKIFFSMQNIKSAVYTVLFWCHWKSGNFFFGTDNS